MSVAGYPGSLRQGPFLQFIQRPPAKSTYNQSLAFWQVAGGMAAGSFPPCVPLLHKPTALTHNTLVPAGQRPPAGAAEGIKARATHIWPSERV
jgi:hypothetical protein